MQTLFDVILIVALGVGLWLAWRARRENAQLSEALAKSRETAEQLAAEQRRTDARITAMIDAPPHALLVLDQDGVIIRANSHACEILEPQLIGKTTIEATRSHEIDSVVQQTLSAQQIEERPVTWNARPYFARVVPIGDGGAVLALEDQSDRLRSDRMRRDFVANISHELRTPLASVRLLIETLLAGAKDEPDVATRMLNQMLGEIDSITQLAQELLDLSLIEAGQMPMQVTHADLGEIAAEQIIHYEPMAQQKQIVVKNDVAEGVNVEVDQKMIGRVLGNLIHNAIKFTPDRGRITIGAAPADDKIKVSVTDTGAGIPQEDLPRIFERFYKVDRARGKSGTGLGLAIARHVVEAHGGRIWAESVEGKGATFYFTLPTAK
jgi:two-component system, OmpR family, phosphate regulon sensor histidine kinase PhoR